jgi:cyclopropane fatty-acyl-phospholipid synthase-like methyltransferase
VPDGNYIHGDVESIEFQKHAFDAVVSFYTIEHIPREEHKTILERINQWLRPSGYLLISTEAAEFEGGVGEWLGVPVYFSSYGPERMKQMVVEKGFEILETEIETQIENGIEVPFLWILCRKK